MNGLNKLEHEETLEYVYLDERNQNYPFGVAFFMYRAGDHKLAIEYLLKSNHESIV